MKLNVFMVFFSLILYVVRKCYQNMNFQFLKGLFVYLNFFFVFLLYLGVKRNVNIEFDVCIIWCNKKVVRYSDQVGWQWNQFFVSCDMIICFIISLYFWEDFSLFRVFISLCKRGLRFLGFDGILFIIVFVYVQVVVIR